MSRIISSEDSSKAKARLQKKMAENEAWWRYHNTSDQALKQFISSRPRRKKLQFSK